MVRQAESSDAPVVAAIFAHYVINTVATFETCPPTREDWIDKQYAVRKAGFPFLVGTVDGEVVGYAYVTGWRAQGAYRHTVENSIYLAPGHLGRGHGRALLVELLAQAGLAGARQVIAVIADTGNPASERLHHSTGFVRAGRLTKVGFKHGRWIDTLLMQRTLDSRFPRQPDEQPPRSAAIG